MVKVNYIITYIDTTQSKAGENKKLLKMMKSSEKVKKPSKPKTQKTQVKHNNGKF